MAHEMTIEIEVPMKVKVRFAPVKAVKMTWGYDGGTPPEAAHIDDLEFTIIAEELAAPLRTDPKTGLYERKEIEIKVCNDLHDIILDAQSYDEWTEQCLESLKE